jgi:hypothetical protein
MSGYSFEGPADPGDLPTRTRRSTRREGRILKSETHQDVRPGRNRGYGSNGICGCVVGIALTCANEVSHVHFVDPAAKLLTNVLTVTCNALFLGDGLGLASPLVTHGNFTYTGCNNGCTATDLVGGLLLALKTASGLARVTGDGFLVRVLCIGIINCEYDGNTLVGHGLSATGTNNGLVNAHEQTVSHTSGLLCPETAKLDALFESLTALYVKS